MEIDSKPFIGTDFFTERQKKILKHFTKSCRVCGNLLPFRKSLYCSKKCINIAALKRKKIIIINVK